jgi:hypothetical protein
VPSVDPISAPTPRPVPDDVPGGRHARAALVIAHPGHELRVHGWLERTRPVVFVLTDGSGGTAHSRVASTRRVLRDLGAVEGPIFGRLTDRELYAAVLRQDAPLFIGLACELAAALVATDRELVVCDAREGYNSAHDLCWFVVEAAVALASDRLARPIACLDFPLMAEPDALLTAAEGAVRLDLNDQSLERKLEAARQYPEMAAEVQAALARFTARAFRVEHLSPAGHQVATDWQPGPRPFYEQYGEQQVAAGVYTEVLRAREHLSPLVASLRQYVREQVGCPASPSS